MDELYFNSTFSKFILGKAVQKVIKDETGYEVKIQLDHLKISSVEGNTTIKLTGEVTIPKEEILKITKRASLI